MQEEKPKLVIIDDDLDVAEMLDAYFRIQGYDVQSTQRGEDGLRACTNSPPDLVLLDIHLPDTDGYEIARRLRGNYRTGKTPIIFLTELSEREDRLQGLELGADDFITKPFDLQELQLRVRNAMRRAGQDSLTNPITGLPDGPLVDERLNDCLQQPVWTLLIASLENLDSYRDTYGFVASDDVLRSISQMIQNAVLENGSESDFLGHLTQTGFVIVSSRTDISSFQIRLHQRLSLSLDYFYPIKDRDRLFTQGKRLVFKSGILYSADEKYTSIDSLKQALFDKRT
jgi:DNA-binding response OmpR family regulator